ncbi:MAG: M24 family metallopeptidase [[Clostridium] innocuum]
MVWIFKEAPFISRTNKEAFQEGTVITLEPGIYVPGLGGIRIEDDFLITRDGCEALTHADRELIVLPF